jgi:hypothetical protein
VHKLRLHLDDLEVESFLTASVSEKRGTIQGQADPYSGPRPHCTALSDPCGGTCEISCNGTCACEATASPYNSCPGGDCFQTDDENTCRYTEIGTCSCNVTYCC